METCGFEIARKGSSPPDDDDRFEQFAEILREEIEVDTERLFRMARTDSGFVVSVSTRDSRKAAALGFTAWIDGNDDEWIEFGHALRRELNGQCLEASEVYAVVRRKAHPNHLQGIVVALCFIVAVLGAVVGALQGVWLMTAILVVGLFRLIHVLSRKIDSETRKMSRNPRVVKSARVWPVDSTFYVKLEPRHGWILETNVTRETMHRLIAWLTAQHFPIRADNPEDRLKATGSQSRSVAHSRPDAIKLIDCAEFIEFWFPPIEESQTSKRLGVFIGSLFAYLAAVKLLCFLCGLSDEWQLLAATPVPAISWYLVQYLYQIDSKSHKKFTHCPKCHNCLSPVSREKPSWIYSTLVKTGCCGICRTRILRTGPEDEAEKAAAL